MPRQTTSLVVLVPSVSPHPNLPPIVGEGAKSRKRPRPHSNTDSQNGVKCVPRPAQERGMLEAHARGLAHYNENVRVDEETAAFKFVQFAMPEFRGHTLPAQTPIGRSSSEGWLPFLCQLVICT